MSCIYISIYICILICIRIDLRILNFALHPQLVEHRFLPICKQADTITASIYLIKMRLQLRQGQVVVHMLPHLKSWDHIQSYLRHYT
ncbi:hypothetical protein D3C85_1542670 [compost metagenome]